MTFTFTSSSSGFAKHMISSNKAWCPIRVGSVPARDLPVCRSVCHCLSIVHAEQSRLWQTLVQWLPWSNQLCMEKPTMHESNDASLLATTEVLLHDLKCYYCQVLPERCAADVSLTLDVTSV